MVPTGAVVLLVVATALAAAWSTARDRRCTCHRDEPLAGLGALGAVTTRVRRRQAQTRGSGDAPARPPLRPVPYPARERGGARRHPVPNRPHHRGASPCP